MTEMPAAFFSATVEDCGASYTWIIKGVCRDFAQTDRLFPVPMVTANAVSRVRSLQPETSATSDMTLGALRVDGCAGRVARTSDLLD